MIGWSWIRERTTQMTHYVRRAVEAFSENATFRGRVLALSAGACVILYILGVLGYVFLVPEIGIRCAFSPEVNHFYTNYLYPVNQEPLQPGDTIVQIGDQPIESWPRLLRQLKVIDDHPAEPASADFLDPSRPLPDANAVLVDGQKLIRVRYRRPGSEQIRSVWCRVGRPTWETIAPTFLWLLLKLGLFVVGALVFWKRATDRSARIFFLFCVISAGAFIGGYHWHRIAPQPILIVTFMVCAILLPAISLHFYLVFPEPKKFLQRYPVRVFGCIYGSALFLLLWLLTDYIRVRWLLGQADPPMTLVEPLLGEMLLASYIAFGVAACCFVASICALLHSYLRAENLTHRNQVKWILLGNLAALLPIGYSFYMAFVHQTRFGGGGATWPMFTASFLLTAAYTVSITRYRLMEIDQLIGSGAMYFLLSSLAGLLYYVFVVAGLVIVGSQVSDGPTLGQVLAVSTTALLLLVALDLARGRLKNALDGHFRREKHNLDQTLEQMRLTIGQLVDPSTLAHRLLHTSAELFGVTQGAIYLRRGDPPLYVLADSLEDEPELTELSSGCPLVEVLAQRGNFGSGNTASPEQRQLDHLAGEIAVALRHEEELVGFFVLGAKSVGRFSAEDVGLLSACSQLASLALVSAEGHQTIQTLNRELHEKVEKIAEQQQRILSLQSQLSHLRKYGFQGTENPLVEANGSDSGLVLGAPSVPPESGVVGSSPQVQHLLSLVRKVATSSSAVLLRGESGTGKGVLARLIHDHSARADRPFLKVHCAALAPSLLESELFGHVKGAFTGAIRDKTGRFEAAHQGTLFLDEIGDISLDVQTKLLRVLQEKTFERVGSIEPIEVDVRIVAATHQNLEELIAQGRFREDLFYRLNVFPIFVLPLRDRIEDIPELVQHFLKVYSQRAGKHLDSVDDDALTLLKSYAWPGNIRQLENIVERAVVISDGPTVTAEELPKELHEGDPLPTKKAPLWSVAPERSATDESEDEPSPIQAERTERKRREREQLVRALAATGGNKAKAARNLGLARSTLVSRLKKHGLG